MATEQIPTSIIADDAVTGDKIENNPTVAGNLTVSGTSTLTGNSTIGGTLATTGAFTASGGIANAGTISAGSISSSVTGFTGIKVLDTWELTTGFQATADPIQNNLQRQTNAQTAYIGSAMTVENGIFTFPMTGKYLLKFHLNHALNGEARYIGAQIASVISGTTSRLAYGYAYIAGGSGTRYTNHHMEALFDVTDVSTHKVKFSIIEDQNTSTSSGTSTNASTTSGKYTYMQFIRIGD